MNRQFRIGKYCFIKYILLITWKFYIFCHFSLPIVAKSIWIHHLHSCAVIAMLLVSAYTTVDHCVRISYIILLKWRSMWKMRYKIITVLFPLKTKWRPTNLHEGSFTWLTYCTSFSTTNINSQVNEISLDFFGAFSKLRKADITYVMSVCLSSLPSVRQPACISSAVNGRIFIKFSIWLCFKNLSGHFKFH